MIDRVAVDKCLEDTKDEVMQATGLSEVKAWELLHKVLYALASMLGIVVDDPEEKV